MTVSTLRAMRHIPEEELNAYLDQALSRSQCVEIESHLAECHACRTRRDSIAALRDRTTALLAMLSPRRAVTPPFELIEARRAAAAARRGALIRRTAWAASLVAAVAAGWGLNQVASGDRSPELAVTAPGTNPAADTRAVPARGADRPDDTAFEIASATQRAATDTIAAAKPRAADRTAPRPANRADSGDDAARSGGPGVRLSLAAGLDSGSADGIAERFAAPQSLQVSSSNLPEGIALDGLWRTLSWENAQEEAGGSPAHVDGLPVVHVQVQQAPSGKPLMVVAQQLGSGEVIRTIEGPADDVSSLLRRTNRPGTSPWPSMDPNQPGFDGTGSIVTMLGDRILAISAPGMSSDSLAAMARRVKSGVR